MKKQYSKVIKIVIQILFFLWIPESFAASLYAVKKLIHAVSVMDFTYAREPVLLLLETVVTTAVFGRYYCGYICSFGAAQDLSYDLGNLIRKQTKYRKKRMLSVKTDKILSKLKYPVLVIVAVSAVWKKNLLDVISPWKGFASLLSLLRGNFSKENLISAGVWICIIVLVISAVFFRAFCRYLCPMGAIFAMMPILPSALYINVLANFFSVVLKNLTNSSIVLAFGVSVLIISFNSSTSTTSTVEGAFSILAA